MHLPEIYSTVLTDRFTLLYAPTHEFSALVNRDAARQLRQVLIAGATPSPTLDPILAALDQPARIPPAIRSGPVVDPYFLGLIPTRACNLACRYCDFETPGQKSRMMDLGTARESIDSYLRMLKAARQPRGELHFFGGEPFHARDLVVAAVEYASWRASEEGIALRFEATTNGYYDQVFCQWIADQFDSIVLSLDGTADIQDRHRPTRKENATSAIVERSAKIFSDSSVELIIRSCITNESVKRMPEIARWITEEFRPASVCFEPLTPTPNATQAGLSVPDPWDFGRYFYTAACLLDASGIEAVYSSADMSNMRTSFCPVGKDAMIVSPGGEIHACYLVPSDWEDHGLDLKIGRLNGKGLELDPAAVERVRQLAGREKPLCRNCLCRYHCAGGCHVHHATDREKYDDTCIQTRILSITKLLEGLSHPDLARQWLDDRSMLKATILQKTDLLLSPEYVL